MDCRNFIYIAGLLLLTVGCTKVEPVVTSRLDTNFFISFQDVQSVSDLDTITLVGSCKKDIGPIEIQDNSSDWIAASSVAEAGSDLDCNDGQFTLKVLSNHASLNNALVVGDSFHFRLRTSMRGLISQPKLATFKIGPNQISRLHASEGHSIGGTGDGYKASILYRDTIVKVLPSGETAKIYLNH